MVILAGYFLRREKNKLSLVCMLKVKSNKSESKDLVIGKYFLHSPN